MWEFIKAGGILMAPIVVLSIIALMIIIERGIRLRRKDILPQGLGFKLATQIAHNPNFQADLNDAEINTPVGRVLAAGITHSVGGLEYTAMQMQTAASIEIFALEKHLNILSIIGTVAPLMGLLGSVLGIIGAFVSVNTGNSGDPALLAAGLAQALICTAAGMFVAIPALIAHRLYQHKVLAYAVDMERQASQLLQVYFGHKANSKHVNALDISSIPATNSNKAKADAIAELNSKLSAQKRAMHSDIE